MTGVQISFDRTLGTVTAELNLIASSVSAEAALRAAYRQAQRTLAKAVTYAPLQYGALRASGVAEQVPGGIEIRFGGVSAPYAVYVHEITTNHHPVGQAKFLERAITEDGPAIVAAIGAPILKKGTK